MNSIGYGGYIWSSHQAENTSYQDAGALAIAAGVGAGAFYTASQHRRRIIDWAAAGSRAAGNLFPLQLLNTFRVPEFLSPFTTHGYKDLSSSLDAGHGFSNGDYVWNRKFLESDESYSWLKYVTGKDTSELRAAGIIPKMVGDAEKEVASELRWTPRGKDRSTGDLFSIVNGERKLVGSNVSLFAANDEVVNVFSGRRGLSAAATGVLAAGKAYDLDNFSEDKVFAHRNGNTFTRSGFIPVPSIKGPVGGVADLIRRSTIPRGYLAFEMGRFNRLIEGVSEQFLGDTGKKLAHAFGIGPGVRPGTATEMFMRFGGKAALAGGLILGASQVDWVRQNYGLAGQVFASTAFSAGLAYGAHALGKSPRFGMGLAVASFFGQQILPGFDQGFIKGMATTGVNADTYIRSNPLNPFGYVRRTLEGFLPGITNWETGALAAVGAMGAAHFAVGGVRIPEYLVARYGDKALGMSGVQASDVYSATKSIRDAFWQQMSNWEGNTLDSTKFGDRAYIMDSLRRQHSGLDLLKGINKHWATAESIVNSLADNNQVTKALVTRLEAIDAQYGADGLTNMFMKQTKGFATQGLYSFFGANVAHDKKAAQAIMDMGFKGPTGRLGRLASVGLLVFGAHQVLTGAAFGSKNSYQRNKDIYSGKELVEVKASRWWEAGGTPFEGGKTNYYRPHAYHLMMNESRDKGIWGDEVGRSPITKFFLKNFTHHLEYKNYYDRPYPVSTPAFADVPIIGGLLGSTVGRLFKPPRLMHVGEWSREGINGQEFASVYQGARREPGYGLGALGPGIPQTPWNAGETFANLSYQFRELEGMTGWAKNVIQNTLTGNEYLNHQRPILASSGEMTSWAKQFWEGQFGGMLFTNEALRRIWPKTPYDKKTFNPIINTMPSWLPDKFHYGDPYRQVEWGEARLPGPGYAALHPELRGLDPEDYPLTYRYAILSDVSPYAKELKHLKEKVYQRRAMGQMSASEEDFVDAIDVRHAAVMAQYQFDRVHPDAIQLPGSSITRHAWFGLQKLVRKVTASGEYLVPMGFRPVMKLMGERDPIEQYEFERMYGTSLAFWDEPARDWLRPAAYSLMNAFGFQGKPEWRREADAASKYFDTLDYIKYMNLAETAENGRDARTYRWAASQTRTGVNPMGSPLSIYWSLPSEDRKYFNAFAHASHADRARIKEMVPSDQLHLYEAVWSRMDSGDPTLWAGADTAVDERYLYAQQSSVEGYMRGKPTPANDWIGWSEHVDMSDIKLKYVDSLARDIHDFGLWESDREKVARQPFLEDSVDYLQGGIGMSAIRGELYGIMSYGGARPWLQVNESNMMSGSANITYNDNREPVLQSMLSRLLNGY